MQRRGIIISIATAVQGCGVLPRAVAVRGAFDPACVSMACTAHRTACRAHTTTDASGANGEGGMHASRSGSGASSSSTAFTSAPEAPSAAAAMSLSDLALVFQQLSRDSAMDAGTSRPPRPPHSPPADQANHLPARRSNSSAMSASTSPPPQDRVTVDDVVGGRGRGGGRTPAHREAPQERFKSTAKPRSHAPRVAMPTPTAHYANTLRRRSDAHLRIELEEKVRQYNYSDMMQCVKEVADRLRPTASRDSPDHRGEGGRWQAEDSRTAVAGRGDAFDGDRPPAPSLMSDHRCLIAFLGALSRVDVYASQTELDSCSGSHAPASAPPLSEQLGHVLLRWLSREVSRVDAKAALLVLHLLAQQRLVHGEAVLETLADTIAVHLERSTVGQVPRAGDSSSSISSSSSSGAPFTLANYAHLLDTMARYQAQLARLAVSVSPRPMMARPEGDETPASIDADHETASTDGSHDRSVPAHTDVGLGTTAPLQNPFKRRHRGNIDVHHPIVNARFFHHVAEALTHVLQPRQPTSSPSSATSSSAPLLAMQSTDFLFLVRALSKLAWWHRGLAAALTPQLSQHIRTHPNSVLVVASFVGRPENTVGDAELMRTIQESVSTLLRRRRSITTSAFGAQGRRADGVVMVGAESGGDVDVDGYDADGVGLSDALDEEEAVQGGRWDRASCEGDEQAGSSARSLQAATPFTDAPAPRAAASAATPPTTRGSTLTLVDMHAMAGLVESLCRYHVRSLEQCSRGTAQAVQMRAELISGMQSMLHLLLDDAQRGVPSVSAAAHVLGPAPLARLLLTLLSSTAALRQAWADSSASTVLPSAEVTSAVHPSDCPHHPFLIELAYTWTVQVSGRRPPPPPPTSPRAQHTPAAAASFYRVAGSVQWRRAVTVHHALMEAGLLCRGGSNSSSSRNTNKIGVGGGHASRTPAPPRLGARFFMPDNVLAAAPRVQAVVDQEKVKINAARARDAQHGGDEASVTVSPLRGRPRYASAALRGDSESNASAAETAHHRHRQGRYRRGAAVPPVRTSAVFAKYAKALARLGC